jgi:FixJ family two-component response regulator
MTNDAQQTVYVIDDDEAVRDALGMLIRSIGLEVVTYASAIAFLEDYDENNLGCLVLDIRMPLMSGLELQDELISRHSTLPIIFISGHGDIPMAVKAVKKGAMDFVSKPFHDQDLLDGIQRALRKNLDIHEKNSNRKQIAKRRATLTPRETQILARMIEGLANKVMAIELEISQRTVEVHRASVMEKMQAKSLAQLVKMVSFIEN